MPSNGDKLAVALPGILNGTLLDSYFVETWIFFAFLKAINKKKDDKTIENPFKMPPDSDIFVLREKEKQQKLKVTNCLSQIESFKTWINKISKERENNKTLKVHQKLTHNQKLIEGMKAGLKPDISDEEIEDDDEVNVSIWTSLKASN